MAHMFADMIPEGWVDKRVLINVYASALSALKRQEVFNRIPSVIHRLTQHSFRMCSSDLLHSTLVEWPDIYIDIYEGNVRLQHRRIITDLLAGKYVFLLAPLERGEENYPEVNAKAVLAQAEGLIALMFGNGILAKKVYQTISEPGLQSNQVFSRPIRSLTDPNAIRLATEASLRELADRLCADSDDTWKRRVQTALTACSRGHSEYDPAERLFHFWTALEVIFGGYRRVAGYINKLPKGAKREGLLPVKELRRNVVHNGAAIETTALDEWLLGAVIIEQIFERYDIPDEELRGSFSSLDAGTLHETHAGTS